MPFARCAFNLVGNAQAAVIKLGNHVGHSGAHIGGGIFGCEFGALFPRIVDELFELAHGFS